MNVETEVRSLAYPAWHPECCGARPAALSFGEFAEAFPVESQLVEFEEDVSSERLQEGVVALSNSDGGSCCSGSGMTGRRSVVS